MDGCQLKMLFNLEFFQMKNIEKFVDKCLTTNQTFLPTEIHGA
jgi:hypothetical protein